MGILQTERKKRGASLDKFRLELFKGVSPENTPSTQALYFWEIGRYKPKAEWFVIVLQMNPKGWRRRVALGVLQECYGVDFANVVAAGLK